MKMVKSLLLGSAAGLVAVAGAQAADLPVKAKPVQYVKICSLYGAGFYYIPGTDMCLKIGGWVRYEAAYGANGSLTNGLAAGNTNARGTNDLTYRVRGYITADARNQTAYGTVRSYIAVGVSTNSTGVDNAANQFNANRAFIQWAGFTFGRTQSFYDFYSSSATALWGAYPGSDTGDPGWQVAAYTAQFGNGLSATLSLEERRLTQIYNAAGGAGAAGATTGTLSVGSFNTSGFAVNGAGAYGGFKVPDVVANLRVDQAWGSAQIMGALHQVNGTYYGAAGTESGGGPGVSTTYGYALGAGVKLLAPMIGKGDYLQAQFNYAVGASRYAVSTPNYNFGYRQGQNGSYGILTDAVYGGTAATASSVEKTSAWGVNAAYEHFWNPAWRTSLYGGYAQISYSDRANAMLCGAESAAGNVQAVTTAGNGVGTVAAAGCNNNWSTTWIGSRTQWNVTPDFYLAVDVMYQKLKSATSATGLVPTGVYAASIGPVAVSDQNAWQFRFRAHKDFYP